MALRTTLRAFAWLRWRMLINSFESTGTRDTVERFSIAVEKLGPIIAGLLLIPSAIVLGVAAVAGGYALAAGTGPSAVIDVLRFALLIILGFSLIGPIVLPSADRTNPIRMLLLPIPRSTMYVAQMAAALADLWVLLTLPLVLGIPVGLAAGGAIAAAPLVLLAGLALALVVAGVAALVTSLMHLVVRDRRRGELLALVFVVIVPMLALLPGLLQGQRGPRDAEGRRPPRAQVLPAWVGPAAERAFGLLPTELYIAATRRAAARDLAASATPLAGLGLTVLLLNGVGMVVYSRILDAPGSAAARRTGPMRAIWGRRIPLLSPGASAVALAQVRLALRTPRGRAILLTPLIVVGVFSLMMWRGGGAMRFGPFAFGSGLTLATFAAAMSLLSILPIAMNQFAVDRAGLTLALLSPLGDREYLTGKAVGNGIIAAMPALVTAAVAALAFPGGAAALWLSLGLGSLATYILMAPVAALASATFPKAVDMNSIGRSNAHGAAGLIGMMALAAAALPGVLLVLAATWWAERPALAPVLLLLWIAIAFGLNRLLSILAARVFARRRENLAMLIGKP